MGGGMRENGQETKDEEVKQERKEDLKQKK